VAGGSASSRRAHRGVGGSARLLASIWLGVVIAARLGNGGLGAGGVAAWRLGGGGVSAAQCRSPRGVSRPQLIIA